MLLEPNFQKKNQQSNSNYKKSKTMQYTNSHQHEARGHAFHRYQQFYPEDQMLPAQLCLL